MNTSRKNRLYRQLLAATLLIGGAFNLAAPVLAAGTKPGTTISNTATATYEDPNGAKFDATSNTVIITVAEVAGITNTASGITDQNGGTIQPNDVLYYNYTITNVGNDPTKIFVPSTATVSGPGAISGSIQYSTDGTNYTNVASGGTTTGSIDVNSTVLVRVPIRVNGTATSTGSISVVLGDTGANDNSAGTQNQPDATDGTLAQEVRTIDNADGSASGEVAGKPANGEREASAVQAATVGSSPTMVNGPSAKADASGPSGGTNDDYTNKSAFITAGTDPAIAVDPTAVNFTNTVKNSSTTDPLLLSLLPTPPATATDLPSGTTVTLSYSTQSATYRYNGTTFDFVSAQGNTADGNTVSATNPIELPSLAPGATADYTVSIDLPSSSQLVGYGVPITAFVDADNNGGIATTDLQNITIDRVYTGYLKLVKESRILQGDGPSVVGTDGNFSTTPKTPAPGNIIEYRITYTNVSSSGGTNDITLEARKVVITEDGTANNNNWAKDNDSNQVIDTSHVMSKAVDAGGTITYTPSEQSGTTAAADVTKYVDTLTNPLAPGQTGTFIFQRKVN